MPKSKPSASSNPKQTAATPILFVAEDGMGKANLSASQRTWAAANGFVGQHGSLLALPGANGQVDGYLFGTGGQNRSPLVAGLAASGMQKGNFELQGDLENPTLAALAFMLGGYRFEQFKSRTDEVALHSAAGADMALGRRLRDAAFIARDLVNMPPNVLGPDRFEAEVRAFAKARKMTVSSVVGDELLTRNFPMIHAVGRASSEAPRLLDLGWGAKSAPKVTLVGKGVTFDTGGLDIKPPAGMALMKKDMGGAANVLGLAHAIIDAKLNIRLRVLLPIVENSISANAFRPGDVLPSRNGMSVEIGNTDAEGRLILADALALADEDSPQILIDMATLTGAARVALGPELPPLYSSDSSLARELVEAGMAWGDPLWHMPLWQPYDQWLSSRIADVSHISSQSFAGSVTAALFLQRFVSKAAAWAHFDIFAWTPVARPAYPIGGADQGIRASYEVLRRRFAA